MDNSVESLSVGLTFLPLIDIGICIVVIGVVGFFLWNKGRYSISPKP